jgi:hypothetical protein
VDACSVAQPEEQLGRAAGALQADITALGLAGRKLHHFHGLFADNGDVLYRYISN